MAVKDAVGFLKNGTIFSIRRGDAMILDHATSTGQVKRRGENLFGIGYSETCFKEGILANDEVILH